MKKLFAVAVVMAVAGSASAASVGFTYGTNFYRPTGNGGTFNGQNFAVNWNLDNDLSLGYYTEATTVVATVNNISAIQVAKGVMKNVSVGLNLGATSVGPTSLADVFGSVNILSGSGDKVSGNLVATASARFTRADVDGGGAGTDGNGYNFNLGVSIWF
jgi:hypothetical protein